ncbi:MAG: DNA methyltransferase [Chloroflexota bacterium]
MAYGDNLDVLARHVATESVDLVYLDPPFNSNADYNVLFSEHGEKSAAQIGAFTDTWKWNTEAAAAYQDVVERGGEVAKAMLAFRTLLGTSDMLAYLSMMAPRLIELRRALKLTGSLYLHCDPTAAHYLKLLLDAVFGPEQFLSEVIWKRTGTHSSAKRWGPVHDTLLMYAKKRGQQTWNRPHVPLGEEHRRRHYSQKDAEGRVYTHGELTAPGIRHGQSGAVWRGFDVTAIGRHWSTTVERLDEMDAEGRIYFPKDNGWPRVIRYEEDSKGRAVGDVWEDIPPINMQARERLGYPTQKPIRLLERLIEASSNPGDLVLDPFCGCGTAIDAAQDLGRRWVGIDITHLSIGLIKHRLLRHDLDIAKTYRVIGEPTTVDDARVLAKEDPFQFQAWALGLVGARVATSDKKGGDKGIDGRLFFHDEGPRGASKQIVLSVKSGHLVPAHVRDLRGVLVREDAEIGVLISFEEPTPGIKAEAASAGFYSSTGHAYPRIQLRTVEELLAGKGIQYPPAPVTVYRPTLFAPEEVPVVVPPPRRRSSSQVMRQPRSARPLVPESPLVDRVREALAQSSGQDPQPPDRIVEVQPAPEVSRRTKRR